MKAIVFIFGLISMFILVELIALAVPGWIMALSFFGLLFYGMFLLIRRSIRMNQ